MITPPRDPDPPEGNAGLDFEVAGIRFRLAFDRPLDDVGFLAAYRPFRRPDPGSRAPDLELACRYGPVPAGLWDGLPKVFDSGTTWTMYRGPDRTVLVARALDWPVPVERAIVLDAGGTRGTLYVDPAGRPPRPQPGLPDPLDYPVAEILMIHLLGQGRGLLAHASGVDDDGRGWLFLGHSGAGKTTLSRLWQGHGRLLNDDRIVLRFGDDGRLWMHGTPWHGDLDEVADRSLPVTGAFVLEHAPANLVQPLGGAPAVAALLARSFPPFWDAAAMDFVLGFADAVVHAVPFHRLGFVPGPDVIERVRCAS